MRVKNPDYMKAIINYVNQYYVRYHRSPSTMDIAAHTPIQKSNVHHYLKGMAEMGMIEYSGQTILTQEIKEMMKGNRLIPILGDIACGLPSDADQIFDETMTLPISLVGEKDDLFLLRASGKSMIRAGIFPGDLVLIRAAEQAEPNSIVVAMVDNECTLKRLKQDEDGEYYLHPENIKMPDISLKGKELRIQGVAVMAIKYL